MSKILDRKQLVLDAMDNKPVERVPAGFWFHFLADEIHSNAFEQPELTEQVLAGEIKYIEESQSDFVKIMTDGFFPYTSESFLAANTSEDLKHLQPLPKDDKWFTYLMSVSSGQLEAGVSIGLSEFQTYVRVIIPQALVTALPGICNITVNLIKGSSLAFLMTVKDVMAVGKIAASFGYNYIEAYLDAFLVYLILCTIIQLAYAGAGRRFGAYR